MPVHPITFTNIPFHNKFTLYPREFQFFTPKFTQLSIHVTHENRLTSAVDVTLIFNKSAGQKCVHFFSFVNMLLWLGPLYMVANIVDG